MEVNEKYAEDALYLQDIEDNIVSCEKEMNALKKTMRNISRKELEMKKLEQEILYNKMFYYSMVESMTKAQNRKELEKNLPNLESPYSVENNENDSEEGYNRWLNIFSSSLLGKAAKKIILSLIESSYERQLKKIKFESWKF